MLGTGAPRNFIGPRVLFLGEPIRIIGTNSARLAAAATGTGAPTSARTVLYILVHAHAAMRLPSSTDAQTGAKGAKRDGGTIHLHSATPCQARYD